MARKDEASVAAARRLRRAGKRVATSETMTIAGGDRQITSTSSR